MDWEAYVPANSLNYILVYKGSSQIYGTASKQIALESPPPGGIPLENKRVFFITFEPDNETISVHPLPMEEVLNPPVMQPKKKKVKEDG